MHKRLKYTVENRECCRPFWEHVHAIGHQTLDKYKRYIRAGHQEPIPRAPPAKPKERPGWETADAWFLQLYTQLADYNPGEQIDLDKDPYEIIPVPNDDHPLWSQSIAIGDNKKGIVKKYLNPGKFEDLFSMHQTDLGSQAVSRTTLKKCWIERWSQFLEQRSSNREKRCKCCAVMDELRSTATTPEEKQEAETMKNTHLSEVRQDRDVCVRAIKNG